MSKKWDQLAAAGLLVGLFAAFLAGLLAGAAIEAAGRQPVQPKEITRIEWDGRTWVPEEQE